MQPVAHAGQKRARTHRKSTANSDSPKTVGDGMAPILVMGMHRSGTSALARLLEMMGAHVGDPTELLPPHPQDNPTGYWERTQLVIEHDLFLERIGYAWDRVAGFDATHLDEGAISELLDRLRGILGRIEAGAKPLVFKDPRLCLLFPLWERLLPNAACVVVVRDPREIAASLDVSHRGVYSSHFLLAMWEKYMRTLLAALRGRPALFVSYARLLQDPVGQVQRLLEGLRELGELHLHAPAEKELASFLDRRLKRSTPLPHVQPTAGQQHLYAWLEENTSAIGPVRVGSFPADHSADEVLHEYERALDANADTARKAALGENAEQLSKLLAAQERLNEAVTAQQELFSDELRRAREQQRLENERHELLLQHERVRADQNADRLAAALRELQLSRDHSANLELIRERLAHETDMQRIDANETIAALNARRTGLELDRDELKASNLDLELDRNRHAQELAEARSELRATRERVVQLSRHAEALTQGIQDLRRSLSWRLTAPLRGVASLFSLRMPWNIEHRLYRTYYSIPGISASRKRRFILWLHDHAAALTRNTLSYRLNAEQRAQQRAAVPSGRGPRMDDARAAAAIAKLAKTPLISIVMPVFNVDRQWLMAAVESVRSQFYPRWQLCIADDASTKDDTIAALAAIEHLGDQRIAVVRSATNQGIGGASNMALKQARGEYVGFLDHDDALTRDALLEVAQRIDAEDSDLIYSDEDKLDETGAHVEVHCKPDFNQDYFFSINYICHFLVARRELIERVGGFRAGFDGAQDYDLLLRLTELSTRIAHIPKVLYHWRKTPASTASASAAKPQSSDAGRRALSESMRRRNIACEVELGPYPNTFRVRRAIIGEPLVSIVIPFRDKPALLQACVESIVAKTRYRNFEIICIDNGSVEEETRRVVEQLCLRDTRVRVLRHDIPFNYSAINNFGADQANGDHLVFLNNDTEVIRDEWLDSMLEQSQRPEVGVVGARLWYADDTIQHAGVIVGPGGVAGHAHLLRPGDDPGYFARIRLPQDLSAVTFACAMTRRDVFRELGGLNDDELKVAFNDIDYCLRAREAGYLVVYTPYALLHHFESKSRGYEDTPEKQQRFSGEIRYMQARHRELLARGDPYYNPNLSLSDTYQPDLSYIDELPE